MPKHTRNTDPADRAAFDATLARIVELTGASTQCQLAEILDVRQSSISDAKRRASIPPEWVLKLHTSHRAMPEWILDGTGPRTIDDIIPHEVRRTAQAVREARAELAAMGDLVRDAAAKARLTLDDIAIHKQCARRMLEQCGQRTDLLLASLDGAAQGQTVTGEQPVAQ